MHRYPFWFICGLCVINGYISGRIVTAFAESSEHDITIEQSGSHPSESVFELIELNDDQFVGKISGDIRVFAAGKLIVPDGSGSIRIPAKPFLTRYIDITPPNWAQFVASKAGKYFYPINSANGQRLAPKNRVYFDSEESAVKAGFLKR